MGGERVKEIQVADEKLDEMNELMELKENRGSSQNIIHQHLESFY